MNFIFMISRYQEQKKKTKMITVQVNAGAADN